eukprot:Polyplicarium_translucidae@DN5475_c0_g1_i1.p1
MGQMELLWRKLVEKLRQLPPATMDASDVSLHPSSRVYWETFYRHLVICLTGFMRHQRAKVAEKLQPPEQAAGALEFTLSFMAQLATVGADEIFKTILEYLHQFSEELLVEVRQAASTSTPQFDSHAARILGIPLE